MAQDTDVARMAAALRTPSMRYRSFGNEAVRNPVPPTPAPPAEDPAFSVLGDALSGAADLPPDTVMVDPAPVPTEAPMLPVRDSYPSYSAGYSEPEPEPMAPDPYAVLERAPPPVSPPPAQPAPIVAAPVVTAPPAASFVAPVPPQPVAVLPVVAPAAVVPPRPVAVSSEPPSSSLLQVLLGGPVQPQPAPPPRPLEPPALPAAPAALPMAPSVPVQPAGFPALPVVPQALPMPMPMPMFAGLSTSSWPPGGLVGGTGSSLLDTLMGVGAGASSATIHYPLLDALGDAMRGTAADPSPRHWPAARVDIALPELLRRIAAGVRFARTAA
ncbi:hypothetical protein [Roseomonas indoligenes]|uniref:Uncharacterized protein n=1 Tax=Roseomonas indoligenes TaxID=2820811 RepID=A0A940MYZ0_9PROT|nr:hypothetical protein [Pararoseomonas indoligenes]MBP0494736.1 hypothetical protein [Pararoseomonas indoligenes]